jgi:hypothetical protein
MGVFDLQVVLSFFYFILFLKNSEVRLHRGLIPFIFFLIFIFVYSFFLTFLSSELNFYFVSRSARAMLTFFFVTIFMYQVTKKGLITIEIFEKALLIALTFNGISVLIQGLIPQTQPFFAKITLYDKSVYPFKGFGLTAGFDTAGLITVYSTLIAIFLYFKKKEKLYMIIVVINFLATFLTSRTPMIFLIISLFFLFLIFPKFGVRISSLFLPFTLILTFGIFILLPLLLSTINIEKLQWLSDFLLTNSLLSQEYLAAFAVYGDPMSTVANEYLTPNGLNFVIGTAGPSQGDPGYIHLIWLGGLVFLFVTFLFYGWILRLRKVFKIAKFNLAFTLNESQELKMITYLYLFMMIIFNLKHFFFFTRGFHDILPLLLGFIYGLYKLRHESESKN